METKKSKSKVLAFDVPIIIASFVIAAITPGHIDTNNFMQHISGIALGFGIAWTLQMLIDLKKEKNNG